LAMNLSPLGQERVFERAYERHVGDVYRYALAVLSDPLDAEEVTFTTFRNAYRDGALPELNGLLAIAHEVCRIRGGYERLAEADFVGGEVLTTAADFRRALGRLPFDQHAVLVMREVEGRRFREIAEILALTISAVEALVFRSRRALREELEGVLTCHEAELSVSRALDGRLTPKERRPLRAHLSTCEECEEFARWQRVQQRALRSLADIPVPAQLQTASFSAPGRLF
jgi:DNA-directed RNA polymerase specialized sigma24 family protein